MSHDLDPVLLAEARRLQARYAIEPELVEMLASRLMDRIAADRARAEAKLLLLGAMLQPICGVRATARLLNNARTAGLEAVRTQVHSLYGLRVANMVEMVLNQAC